MSKEAAPTALISATDWRKRRVRWGVGGAQTLLLVALVIVGLGPLLWLAKSAITPTLPALVWSRGRGSPKS